jgi:hypothetical protein
VKLSFVALDTIPAIEIIQYGALFCSHDARIGMNEDLAKYNFESQSSLHRNEAKMTSDPRKRHGSFERAAPPGSNSSFLRGAAELYRILGDAVRGRLDGCQFSNFAGSRHKDVGSAVPEPHRCRRDCRTKRSIDVRALSCDSSWRKATQAAYIGVAQLTDIKRIASTRTAPT